MESLPQALEMRFSRYARPFRKPLQTGHGEWPVREGLIVELRDEDGCQGWGEVAPLPAFGTETLAEAEAFLESLENRWYPPLEASSRAFWEGLSGELPSVAFALGSALEEWQSCQTLSSFPEKNPEHRKENPEKAEPIPVAALLPSGEGALAAFESRQAEGFRTFKWKVGVLSVEEEQSHFTSLLEAARKDVSWRLDPNGNWTQVEAERWLSFLQAHPHRGSVEFAEQPLPVGQEEAMRALAEASCIPLALDESVGTVRSLRRELGAGWAGLFVIKPALAGAPQNLRETLWPIRDRVVISSAFETVVGLRCVARLYRDLKMTRAAGLDTARYFPDTQSGKRPERGSLDPRSWLGNNEYFHEP